MSAEQFPAWDRNTRTPVPTPPPQSCDCQFHIFDDVKKYPPKPTAYAAAGHDLRRCAVHALEAGVLTRRHRLSYAL
jgi:hypothetical protein